MQLINSNAQSVSIHSHSMVFRLALSLRKSLSILIRPVINALAPRYEIKHFWQESNPLFSDYADPMGLYNPAGVTCFCFAEGATLIVVQKGSTEGSIRYDYFSTNNPKGLFVSDIRKVMGLTGEINLKISV